MSDATLVAQEIQDLASAVGEVTQALRAKGDPVVTVNVPEAPPPTVTVNVPEQPPAPAPQVTVNVPEAPPPVVNIAPAEVRVSPEVVLVPPLPVVYKVQITKRDVNGFISEFMISPVEV